MFEDNWMPFEVINGTPRTVENIDSYGEPLYLDDALGLVDMLPGWTPVSGLSGQDRYDGPIMHEDEYLPLGALKALGDGIYHCVEVVDNDGGESVGWALMRFTGEV